MMFMGELTDSGTALPDDSGQLLPGELLVSRYWNASLARKMFNSRDEAMSLLRKLSAQVSSIWKHPISGSSPKLMI